MPSIVIESVRYNDVTRIEGSVTREGTESPHAVKYTYWTESADVPLPGDVHSGGDNLDDLDDALADHTPPL